MQGFEAPSWFCKGEITSWAEELEEHPFTSGWFAPVRGDMLLARLLLNAYMKTHVIHMQQSACMSPTAAHCKYRITVPSCIESASANKHVHMHGDSPPSFHAWWLRHRGPAWTHRRRRWVHWLSLAPISVGGFTGHPFLRFSFTYFTYFTFLP